MNDGTIILNQWHIVIIFYCFLVSLNSPVEKNIAKKISNSWNSRCRRTEFDNIRINI